MTNQTYPLSPLDGRYQNQIAELSALCSEFGLMKNRLHIEVEYFIALCGLSLPQLAPIDYNIFKCLRGIVRDFDDKDFQRIKAIEKEIKHDVKAVEYFLQTKFRELDISFAIPFIHFGLTSQDINCPANMLMLRSSINTVINYQLSQVSTSIKEFGNATLSEIMLSHTHGQPASPTSFGKEMRIFWYRLQQELSILHNLRFYTKFGGAVGNFNAHKVAYPDIDWRSFADKFIASLNMERNKYTTQIDNYEVYSRFFDCLKRINCILIDFSVDIWTYISKGYLKQKVVEGEVGSSTMPHKVNPINFENAEGNLTMANSVFEGMSRKLPISRMQRDLTDSTILRNIGVGLGYSLIAYKSLLTGMKKIEINSIKLAEDLNNNLEVVGEAIQTILRREGIVDAYEQLKNLTRNNSRLTKEGLIEFINGLNLSENVKNELKAITPENYIGYASERF